MKALFTFMIVLSTLSLSAQRTVSGVVTGADGNQPLIGVNILIKGTSSGEITDFDGRFSITVPSEESVLVFSYTGYESQEITVGSLTDLNVTLQLNATSLDEIVVTAIGITADKSNLGYSIQSVKADEMRNSGETNLVAALAGKAAGVQVTSSGGTAGAAAQIRIRGNKTIIGRNAPLFVVDGIPIDNSTFTSADSPEDAVSDLGSGGVNNSNRAIDLNPDDVESMTVLKGPAATALYGIRAANGAIVITTKRGRDTNGKPRVNVSSSITFDRVNKLPELQRTYAQGNPSGGVPTFAGPMTGSFTGFSWGPLISDLRYASEASPWDRNGLIVHKDDPRATANVANAYDNAGDFFETAITNNNYVSVSGGTSVINYFMSGGNMYQTGIIPNTKFNRTSFKATIGANISEKMRATLSGNYVNSGGRRAQNGSKHIWRHAGSATHDPHV